MQFSHVQNTYESLLRQIRKRVDAKLRRQNELLAKQLRVARRLAKRTQKQVAAQIGRDQTYIARMETGSQWITFAEVEELAHAYGKSLDFFATWEAVEREDPSRSNRLWHLRNEVLASIAPRMLEKSPYTRRKQ